MRILGIETSCDETGASVVEDGKVVLSNVLATAAEETAKFGGVFPEVAARKQVECIIPVIEEALKKATGKIRNSKYEIRNKFEIRNFNMSDIDAIAVTKGPGLLTSLLVGVMAARTLASAWRKPLIGVHHTLGHLDSPWLNISEEISFPVLALSVSGGHTDLWLRESHTKGCLLGRTLDDAAGEAFDKGAVQLGLPYPGGPALSRMAEGGNPNAVTFPSPLHGEETCNFSFAGLKTALKYYLRDRGGAAALAREEKRDVAASYQEAICRHLVSRIERAAMLHSEVREVHLVGGVSANIRLRRMLSQKLKAIGHWLKIRWPSANEFCTDNAAMVAGAAFFMVQELGEKAYRPFETEASVSLTSASVFP